MWSREEGGLRTVETDEGVRGSGETGFSTRSRKKT